MDIGPLEYLVISLPSHQFKSEILPELLKLRESGFLRIVDLLFLSKDGDGILTTTELNDQNAEELVANADVKEDLLGVLSTVDIEQLAENMSLNTEAVVLVLEHLWVLGLTEAVSRAGGTVISGGLIGPVELCELEAELSGKEELYA